MAAVARLSALQDRTIMVVEDEFFQAKDLAQALAQAGARLRGPFPSLSAAMEALESGDTVDAAVLDINLRDRVVYDVADMLAERGIPFLFATGYDPDLVPAAHRDRPVCIKPFRIEVLLAAVADLVAGPSTTDGQQQAQKLS